MHTFFVYVRFTNTFLGVEIGCSCIDLRTKYRIEDMKASTTQQTTQELNTNETATSFLIKTEQFESIKNGDTLKVLLH